MQTTFDRSVWELLSVWVFRGEMLRCHCCRRKGDEGGNTRGDVGRKGGGRSCREGKGESETEKVLRHFKVCMWLDNYNSSLRRKLWDRVAAYLDSVRSPRQLFYLKSETHPIQKEVGKAVIFPTLPHCGITRQY